MQLPAVVQLNPAAAPFCAYRTLTLMDTQYLPVEMAVRTILGQVAVPPASRSRSPSGRAARACGCPANWSTG